MMELSPDRQASASHANHSAEGMSGQPSVPEAPRGGLYTDSGGASTGSDTTPHALSHRPQHEQQASEAGLLRATKHADGRLDR